MADTKAPVVFIHGLWLHATSWQPWQELFAGAGYQPSAPGWPGDADTVEATRANPDAVANQGIEEITDHNATIIDALPAPPILIGHSFGGLIAEKLLGMDRGTAAIGIDAAQIKGVLQLPLSQLRGTLSIFANPANRHKAVSLTASVRTTGPGGRPALAAATVNSSVALATASSRLSACTISRAPYRLVPIPLATPPLAATASANSTTCSRVSTAPASASIPTLHLTARSSPAQF